MHLKRHSHTKKTKTMHFYNPTQLFFYRLERSTDIFIQVMIEATWRNQSELISTLSLKRIATFSKLPFFCRRVYTNEYGVIHHFGNANGSHDPGLHDPDPGPQEKSMKKSCVSFETGCIYI